MPKRLKAGLDSKFANKFILHIPISLSAPENKKAINFLVSAIS